MDFVVFIGISVVALGLALPFLILHQAHLSPTAALRRRVEALAPGGRPGGAGADVRARQQLIHNRMKELERQRSRRRNTLSHLIQQSGLTLGLPAYFGLSALLGGVVALLLFLTKMVPIAILAGGVAGAVWLPRAVLLRIIKNRQKAFTQYFAEALDILVRGARTGLPVGECLRIVGREVPDPVGYEFRMLVESQRIGITTEQALERGLQRMPTAEFQFFAVVLVVQQQTGGNLAATLENLANVLRQRKRLWDKVAALSSEAKSSAMIIGALPFAVGSMIYLVNPKYIGLLFTTKLGSVIIAGGLAWMLLGIMVMRKMINFKV